MAGLHKEITVRITYDGMEAYVLLSNPGPQEFYTKSEILAALQEKGIKVGIRESAVEELLAGQSYGREVLVAKGTPAVDGKDAYFEYNFKQDLDNKPVVRPDGSVDYWSIRAIEIVEEGQIIATYVDPVDGRPGVTVTGKTILSKRGRALPPITGKGFERSADNRTYRASITGKIELKNNRIMILPVYEISSDVDMTTGNIDFRGDVIIHGNVAPGAKIHATGTVTVDGTAESCRIEAGKQIILRGGFLGGYKGVLKCKGDIVAKFIEYATVEAEGMIEITSALNSSVISYDRVLINGKTANVVGGSIYGAAGVEAYSLGTAAEVRTMVSAGVSRDLLAQATELRGTVTALSEMIDKINNGIRQFDLLAAENHVDGSRDERRVSLLRARITKQAELSKASEELGRLEAIMERSKNSCVRVSRTVYPGVSVEINGFTNNIKEEQASVEFREKEGSVVMLGIVG
jgi:uncharacterized protein (DUF342 family)